MKEVLCRVRIGPFVLETFHEPTSAEPVLWRTVTCIECGKMLTKGKLTEETSMSLGMQDALSSLGHECQVQ